MPFNGSITVSQNPVATGARKYGKTFWRAPLPGMPGHRNCSFEDKAEEGWGEGSFTLYGPLDFLEDFFANALTRDAQAFDEDGVKVYEGMLYSMTLWKDEIGAKVSMDDVYNSAWMRYRLRGTPTTVRSTVITIAESIALYGTKQKVLAGGELESIAVANQAVLNWLNWHKRPRPTPQELTTGQGMRGGEPNRIEVVCQGYWITLKWQIYNQTASTGSQAASSEVTDILTAKCPFVATSTIFGNGTLVSKEYDVDRNPADIITDISHLSSPDNQRFLARMTDDRAFYYGPAAPPVAPVVV